VNWEVRQGDALDEMRRIDAASIDAVVTDPPYALTGHSRGSPRVNDPATPYGRARIGARGFMNKTWDAELPGVETWSEALRVMKPGAHLVAFGGTRTFHRLTCAIEDAGFEIRDCLSWMYGQGFPKSMNVGNGLGTALKPAWEPIILARRPVVGTVAQNVLAHGTGALNVDGCRIDCDQRPERDSRDHRDLSSNGIYGDGLNGSRATGETTTGRWPANLVLDEEAARQLDEQSGELTSGANPTRRGSYKFRDTYHRFEGQRDCDAARGQDSGGASRFFYTAKSSSGERHYAGKNKHPTVKPVDLMRWLCRLVTPKGGLILDPFMGSGSTGIAALAEGFRFIGIDLDTEYVEIARRRIAGPLFAGLPGAQEETPA
jgi:site-specific DNA-methyltransferase (adenine-specific)